MFLLLGDFNGSPRGTVFKYMKSQGYKSAQEQYWNKQDSNYYTDISLQQTDGNRRADIRNRWETWISHKSHRGDSIAVDHVFYSNPSDQRQRMVSADSGVAAPDWTRLVFDEIRERMFV